MSRAEPYHTLHGRVKRTTEKAVLFELDLENVAADEPIWIPRSQIFHGDDVDVGDDAIMVIEWWLKDKGIDW
jgi:hypothetical protein